MGIQVSGLTVPLVTGNAHPRHWPPSSPSWCGQPSRAHLGTPDHLLPEGTPSPGDPAPRCWHRTVTGPAPPPPPTWISPVTWEPPRSRSAATLLLPVFVPRVSRCPHASSTPATSSPSPRGMAAGRVGCIPRGHRACVGCRQPAAGSCPGTSGQPGVFGVGRWSQAAPQSLALPGSIPGQVFGRARSPRECSPSTRFSTSAPALGTPGTGQGWTNGVWEQRDRRVLALAPPSPPT